MKKMQLFFISLLVVILSACTSQLEANKKNKIAKSVEVKVIEEDHDQINDKDYTTKADKNSKHYKKLGKASYYHNKFNGRRTASGEIFSNKKLTAAHRSLPMGTYVRVTNLKNKRQVTVRINDRGPFVKGRIIDLSRAAAQKIGMIHAGVAEVKVEQLHKINRK